MIRTSLFIALLAAGALGLFVVPASASTNCYNSDAYSPCNWHTGGADVASPYVVMGTGGNGNFSINVSGGNYFNGCYTNGTCSTGYFIQGGTTGPLIRHAGAFQDVYAQQLSGGLEDTTLFFPYP